MEYCLKVNTQPSVSPNETKLYLKTTDETNFVDQKITYEYEVKNVEMTPDEIITYPTEGKLKFDGIIREKKNNIILSEIKEVVEISIKLYNVFDLNGSYYYHNIEIPYAF